MVIEILPIEFFRGKYFKIFVLRNDEKVVGFYQLIENGPELIFEFVGVDYTYNYKYELEGTILQYSGLKANTDGTMPANKLLANCFCTFL